MRPLGRVRGFTLIELLVVIAIIGILAALLLSAFSAAKERAIRTKCLSNIKQFAAGVLSYGHDFGDRLPQADAVIWAGRNDTLPGAIADHLDRYYVSRKCMFDPGAERRVPPGTFELVWDVMTTNYWNRETSYVLTFGAAPTLVAGELGPNANFTITPQPVVNGSVVLPPPIASERILIAGQVLSIQGRDPALKYTYDYSYEEQLVLGQVSGGGVITYKGPGTRRTSHMDSRRKLPTGDNEAFLDGSARWRSFKVMRPRVRAVPYVAQEGAWWW